jgi:hypothetical protein
MKLSECEKLAEEYVRGKLGKGKKVDITTVKQKNPTTYEVKGYCEDTKFSIDVDTDLYDIIGYDFTQDPVTIYKPPREVKEGPP